MEEVSPAEECLVCGRELGVSRWVRGANQLRHSGRAVAEAVAEVVGCGVAAAGPSCRLCFRCYRLLLGLDYHTCQMGRQRVALLRLYREREIKEVRTSGGNLSGAGDELSSSKGRLSGTGDELPGTVVQERENKETRTSRGNLSGTGEELAGTEEKSSDIVSQERENMDIQSRGGNLTSTRVNLSSIGTLNPCGTDGCDRENMTTQTTGGNFAGIRENLFGTGENLSGTCTVNLCGTVDSHGTAEHEGENTEMRTRGENSFATCTLNPCGTVGQERENMKTQTREESLPGTGTVNPYCMTLGEALQQRDSVSVCGRQHGLPGDSTQKGGLALCSYDHKYHKNSAVVPVEGHDLPTIMARGHQEQHNTRSPSAKRRKTAKKWDDFEYYEDESKTSEVEGCDGPDQPTPARHFQLPLRTGKKKCPECKEEFSTKRAVLSHRCHQVKRKEHEKVTYTCKGCLRRFLLRREYLKHADACYKNTPVTCSLCLVKLPSAAYLPRHLAALHQVKPPPSKGGILCEACGRGFSRKEALERHEARVHGKAHGSHQCPLCGRTFPHTSLLAEHLRAHQGYSCSECSKVFSCRSNLTLHRRAHHMRKAAYHCTACNKHWKFHASYTYHMKKFHGNSEQQRCGGCRLVVCSMEALRQHSLTCPVYHTQSPGQEAALEDMQGAGREVMKPLPNSAPSCGSLLSPAHLRKKGPDSLVLLSDMRKMQSYPPPNTSHQAPPAGEIVVEVLEDTDADYQYIILVEDAAVAHFTMADTAAIWNTSGCQ